MFRRHDFNLFPGQARSQLALEISSKGAYKMALTEPAGILIQLIGAGLFILGLIGLLFWGGYGHYIPLGLGIVFLVWGRQPSSPIRRRG